MAVTREPEFGTVRMREGYDLDDVDDFVDVVIDALEGHGSSDLTPEQIERYEFRVVRMKTSYVMEDVDRWLDAAASELRSATRSRREPRSAPAEAPAEPVRTPAPAAVPRHEPVALDDGPQTAAWPGPLAPPAPPAAVPAPVPAPVPVVPAYQPPVPAYEPPAPAYEAPAPAYEPAAWDAPAYADPLTAPAPPSYVEDPTYGRTGYDVPSHASGAPQQSGYGETDRTRGRSSALIHHVELWVRDFDSAVASFGWLFQRLGWRIGRVWEHGCAWTSSGGPYIVIESGPDLRWMPHDRRSPGLNHLAFEVPDRGAVDRIVAEGPGHGWQLMFPDRHPFAGGPDHYAAYLENAEGFEVEIVAAD